MGVGNVCRDCEWGNGGTAAKREEATGRARAWIIPGGDMRVPSSKKDRPSEEIGVVASIGTLGIG
jgi:hypothetical protein